MRIRHVSVALVAAGVLAAGSVASSAPAPLRSSDETALSPTRLAPSAGVEKRVDALLRRMTTKEKLQQVQLLSDGQVTDADAEGGRGRRLQPGRPDPDQRAASTSPSTSRGSASRSCSPTTRSTATGRSSRCRWAPRARSTPRSPAPTRRSAPASRARSASSRSTARWSTSRTSPAGAGSSRATARTRTSAPCSPRPGSRAPRVTTTPPPTRSVTSVKHYVAYGQPEGGRDYNTTDMSEQRLRNLYLPPFKAAVDAGADTVMCSFNAINGVPGCANKYTETQILKKEWGFDGFIESDYTAVAETRACPPKNPDEGPCGHGTAADGPEAGPNALMAGTDSEMVSTNIRDFGEQLLAQHRITMSAARRRRTPDPAGEVPRRALRAPVRRPGEGHRPGQLRDRGRPQGGPHRGRQVDGAAAEQGRHPAARPDARRPR